MFYNNRSELEELRREVKVITRRVEALERRLTERSAAEEALERRRKVKRENQARYRAKKKAPVGTTYVVPTKEAEKEKEKVPPTPPIKREEEKEEERTTATRTRARAREDETTTFAAQCERWWAEFAAAYPAGHNDEMLAAKEHFVTVLGQNPPTAPMVFRRIMEGLKLWLTSPQWTEDEGRYIPSIAHWVAREKWNDCPRPFSFGKEPTWRKNRRKANINKCDLPANKIGVFD